MILTLNVGLLSVGAFAGEMAFNHRGSTTAAFWAAYLLAGFAVVFGYYLLLSLAA
jgi:hypothetical protein